jgi:hypothetical protein
MSGATDMIPVAWLDDIVDELAFLEEWDVDWKDHHGCVEVAMDFVTYGDPKEEVAMDFVTYGDPKEFLRLRKELKGTGIFRD